MAGSKNAAPEEAKKATPKGISAKEVLANRMAAVSKAGNMTPKMQRGFNRFANNILKGEQ